MRSQHTSVGAPRRGTRLAVVVAVGVAACGLLVLPLSVAATNTHRGERVTVRGSLLHAYAIFRRARVASDRLPRLGPGITGSFRRHSIRVDQSRRASVGDGSLWLVPGPQFLCVVFVGGAGCMPIAYAIKVIPHWTYGGKGPGSPTEFNGFIPDGVYRLTLEFSHGAPRTITVHENAFGVSLREIPRAIKFREPSGAIGVVQVGS